MQELINTTELPLKFQKYDASIAYGEQSGIP